MPMLKMLSGLVAAIRMKAVRRAARRDLDQRAGCSKLTLRTDFHEQTCHCTCCHGPTCPLHEGVKHCPICDADAVSHCDRRADNSPALRVHEAMSIAERMSVKSVPACRTPGCSASASVMKGPPGGRPFAVGDRVRRRDEPDGAGTVTERWDTGHLIVKWDGRPNDQLFGETGLVWLDGGLCFRCHDRAWFAPRSKVEGPCDGHPTTELAMFMTYAAFLITIAAYAVFLIAACAAFKFVE